MNDCITALDFPHSRHAVSEWVKHIENCFFEHDLQKLGVTVRDYVDTRSDESILAGLQHHHPVKSEKNVWAFWQTGLETIPTWSQRNIIGWVRLLGPEWTVRVLDTVDGSPNNVTKFVQPNHLPNAFNSNTMAGQFTATQASDMVRLPCIYEHGGVYMDVGIMLFMHLDDLCWKQLGDKGNSYEIAMPSVDPSLASGITGSFFIAARKRNGFVYRWMNVFREIWKDRRQCQGIHAHPLLRHLVAQGNVMHDLRATSPLELDYFGHILSMERVRRIEDPQDGFNGPAFCRQRLLLLEYEECASASLLANNDGRKQFQMLSTMLQQGVGTKEYLEAENFATFLFSQTAMMKLYHWTTDDTPTLAKLWDESLHADNAVGTFAWLLRVASVYFKQSRILQPAPFPKDSGAILVAGVLEISDDIDD